MKLEIRFNNGYWKLFAAGQYKDLACFDSYKEAERAMQRRGGK